MDGKVQLVGTPASQIGEELREVQRIEPEPEKKPKQIELHQPPKPEPESLLTDTTKIPENLALITEPARLRILCQPWARVFVDGKEMGTTPFAEAIELSAGEHEIILLNPKFPPITETITLKAGEEYPLSINLYDYVGVVQFVSVKPWANIYLDGKYIDQTPRDEKLLVTLNDEHTIRLEHPGYLSWEKHIIFRHGDPPLDIRVGLTKSP